MLCTLSYFASTLLWTVLNPFGLWQTIAQGGGQVLAVFRRLREQARDRGKAETAVTFSLPFAGEWTVVNGGVTADTSHSWNLIAQRYAYDFVITDDAGQSYTGEGRTPQAYHCFGRPILAAANGEVVAVEGRIADYGRCRGCWIDWRTRDIRGNHVIIKHAPGVYSLSAHLQQGSVTVSVGDQVQRGQQIARCGNTGHSTEPHLHFQVQDHPNFFLAVGRPIRFQQYVTQPVGEAGAATAVAAGYVRKGRRVKAAAQTAAQTAPPVTPHVNVWDLLMSLGIFVLGVVGITYILMDIAGWLLRLII